MNLLGQQVRRWGSQSDFSKAAGMFHWADKELGKRIDKLIGTWTATKSILLGSMLTLTKA